jgi:phosphate transport system protein
MAVMLRKGLQESLQRLQDEVLLMGSMVEKALSESAEALRLRDLDRASAQLADLRNLRRMRFSIEESTIGLIVTQHPVASDLRLLTAALEISSELEHMGRYLDEINRVTIMSGAEPLPRSTAEVLAMARKAGTMLHHALTSFVQRDLELAQAVAAEDDHLDGHYERMNAALSTMGDHVYSWAGCLRLLRVAHNLERLGDRVVNISEWVAFAVTGDFLEMG